jgi:hypothetical protein
MSTEVRLLDVCRTLNSDPATAILDEFTSIGASWLPDATGGWIIDGVATAGIIVSVNGSATTTNYSELLTGCFDDQSISTTKFREISLANPIIPTDNGEISILMDMNNATPVPAASVRMRVWFQTNSNGGFFYEIRLSINDVTVANVLRSLVVGEQWQQVRLSIDSSGLIQCYGPSPSEPIIEHRPAGYNPAGGRIGIALKSSATGKTSAASLTFKFTLAAVVGVTAADLPPRALVASANGLLFVELKNGTIKQIPSTVRTLASDRLLSSVNRLQNLYIADYGLRKYGTTGTTGTPGTSFDDAAVANWTTLGIDTDDDRLEILSGTGVTVGIYAIAAVAAGNLTLGQNAGNGGSSITYRIVRGPKVFDSSLMTLTLMPLGTIGSGSGQPPVGCTIVTAWDDRLIWTGDPLFPHVAYMSKAGDPLGYLYANSVEGEAFAYDPARVAGASQIGDAVTAVIPHSYDYCMFGGYRSMSIQRGDPTLGGALDMISRDIGIIDKKAFCYTPEQVVLGLSADGLYLFYPEPNRTPERVSRELIPAELFEINTALFDVQMAYDVGNQGADIFITPKTAGPTTHWWFDWSKKAFWPEQYFTSHEPTAVAVHAIGGAVSPAVIFGCRDGYIRRSIRTQSIDDGNGVPSFALLGPFNVGQPGLEGIVHDIWVELATQSGVVTVDILPGDSAEKARKAQSAYSFEVRGGGDDFAPALEICRVRCSAFFIRITNIGAEPWALEGLSFTREITGKRRVGTGSGQGGVAGE